MADSDPGLRCVRARGVAALMSRELAPSEWRDVAEMGVPDA
jgi:hypothetical protein